MRGSGPALESYGTRYIFQFTPLHERQLVSSHGSASHELFQFTPLHERQQHLFDVYSVHVLFQFTPLHERQRSSLGYTIIVGDDFNSRLYMRGSMKLLPCQLNILLFQFTPLHERQHVLLAIMVFPSIFQFTPLHERQLQKYTIFSIKSTQFSTKPCFFIVTSRKVVLFSIPVQYFL